MRIHIYARTCIALPHSAAENRPEVTSHTRGIPCVADTAAATPCSSTCLSALSIANSTPSTYMTRGTDVIDVADVVEVAEQKPPPRVSPRWSRPKTSPCAARLAGVAHAATRNVKQPHRRPDSVTPPV